MTPSLVDASSPKERDIAIPGKSLPGANTLSGPILLP